MTEYLDATRQASAVVDHVDESLDRYGRLVRALDRARCARGLPWGDDHITLPQLRALSLLASR